MVKREPWEPKVKLPSTLTNIARDGSGRAQHAGALAGGFVTGLVVVASTFVLIIRSWLGRGWK